MANAIDDLRLRHSTRKGRSQHQEQKDEFQLVEFSHIKLDYRGCFTLTNQMMDGIKCKISASMQLIHRLL